MIKSKIVLCILVLEFTLLLSNIVLADYASVMTRKDSSKDFDEFIAACGREEREDSTGKTTYAEEREAQGDDWDPQEELFDPPEGVT